MRRLSGEMKTIFISFLMILHLSGVECYRSNFISIWHVMLLHDMYNRNIYLHINFL